MRLALTFSLWSPNIDQWIWMGVWFFAHYVLDSHCFIFLQNNEAKCTKNQEIEVNWQKWTKFSQNKFYDTNSDVYTVSCADGPLISKEHRTWNITIPMHFHYQKDYVQLKLSQTSILMKLSSKQTFKFSLNFLTFPMGCHLKTNGHIEICHSISEKFSSLAHIWHSLMIESLLAEKVSWKLASNFWEKSQWP